MIPDTGSGCSTAVVVACTALPTTRTTATMPLERGGDASQTGSLDSLGSYDTSEGNEDAPDMEEREKHLAGCSIDEDVDMSLAFVNIHERSADKT